MAESYHVFAVYYRYRCLYAEGCETVEEAIGILQSGADDGQLSAIGVCDTVKNKIWLREDLLCKEKAVVIVKEAVNKENDAFEIANTFPTFPPDYSG